MVESGVLEEWWDCPVKCDCFLRDVHNKLTDGKTAYENMFGVPFHVERHSVTEPISSMDESRLHQFGKKIGPNCS